MLRTEGSYMWQTVTQCCFGHFDKYNLSDKRVAETTDLFVKTS